MKFQLNSKSVYEDEEWAWFVDNSFNGFYKMNKNTSKAEFLFHIPGEDQQGIQLFGYVEKVGDWLVFPPVRGKQIFLFHLVTNEIKTFPLKPVEKNALVPYSSESKFLRCYHFENIVYFFPSTYPAIVKLDLNTMSLQYLDTWMKDFEKLDAKENFINWYFFTGTQEGSTFMVPCGLNNHIAVFDAITEKISFEKVNCEEMTFLQILADGTYYWLTPKKGYRLIRWDRESNTSISLELDSGIEADYPKVGLAILKNNTIYISSGVNNTGYEVNIGNNSVLKVDYFENMRPEKKIQHQEFSNDMMCFRINENYLHFTSPLDKNWYCFDLETKELSKKSVFADEIGISILKKKPIIMYENKDMSLFDFCEGIQNLEISDKNKCEKLESVGQQILKQVLS